MPAAVAGKATPEELRALKAACDSLRDRACGDFVKSHSP
jgi:hypothetical protein